MDVHRDLGRHDAQIEALQARLDQLHRDCQAMSAQLAQINATLASATGGWKTLMAVGGFAGAVTALVIKLGEVWARKP